MNAKQGGKAVCRIFSWTILGVFLLAISPFQVFAAPRSDPQTSPGELVEAYVYFADDTGTHLRALSKFFPGGQSAHELARAILETLFAGAPAPSYQAVFPIETRVNALFITRDNTAVVDIGLDLEKGFGTDTLGELLMVYSLVNSLTVNIEQIDQVKILVNGTEDKGFGPHISLEPYFKTHMLIVK